MECIAILISKHHQKIWIQVYIDAIALPLHINRYLSTLSLVSVFAKRIHWITMCFYIALQPIFLFLVLDRVDKAYHPHYFFSSLCETKSLQSKSNGNTDNNTFFFLPESIRYIVYVLLLSLYPIEEISPLFQSEIQWPPFQDVRGSFPNKNNGNVTEIIIFSQPTQK